MSTTARRFILCALLVLALVVVVTPAPIGTAHQAAQNVHQTTLSGPNLGKLAGEAFEPQAPWSSRPPRSRNPDRERSSP